MVCQEIQVRTNSITFVIDDLSIEGANGLSGQAGFQGQKGERGKSFYLLK